MSHGDQDFSEDLFEHTKMGFWDHIEELRSCMWRAIMGFLVGLVVGLFFGQPAVEFIAAPVEKALVRFHNDRRTKVMQAVEKDPEMAGNEPRDVKFKFKREALRDLRQALGLGDPGKEAPTELVVTATIRPYEISDAIAPSMAQLTRPPTLSTLSATEAFIVYLKVSMYCGIILTCPWIFYQLWSFVAAGLYPQEKKLIHVFLPISIALFLAGVSLCEFGVLPIALKYLLSFNDWMNLEPDLRLSEWLSFAILFPLMFGIAFQLPLLMYALHRIGIVNVSVYRNNRRIAYFLIACSYIVIGMSPDAISMLSLIIPLFALYELGILMCRFSPPPLLDLAGEDGEDMIEA